MTFGIVTALPVYSATIMSLAAEKPPSMTEEERSKIQAFWWGVMFIPLIIAICGLLYWITGTQIFAFLPWIWIGCLALWGKHAGV